jgi:hypothetical protein
LSFFGKRFASTWVLWSESCLFLSSGVEGGFLVFQGEGPYSGVWIGLPGVSRVEFCFSLFAGGLAYHWVVELGTHSLAATSLPLSQVCTSLSDGAVVMETRKDPFNSSVSTSQLWYTRRVKEKVAKQLNKNKDLLAEAVVDILVVGEGRVSDVMNLAFIVGLSWGGEDKKLWDMLAVIDEPVVEASEPKVKGMRELKNLDCSISPVKGQRRQGFLGLKNVFSFPPEVH